MSCGQSVTILSCRISWAMAGAGKLKLAPAVNDAAPVRTSRRLMAAAFSKSGKPATVEIGALGDVAPIHNRRPELRVALVDFPRERVAGACLGNDILARREKGPQHGVVEFEKPDRAFSPELAQ